MALGHHDFICEGHQLSAQQRPEVFDFFVKLFDAHKFDGLDLDALTATCFHRGYPIWTFEPLGDTAYPRNMVQFPKDGSGAAS